VILEDDQAGALVQSTSEVVIASAVLDFVEASESDQEVSHAAFSALPAI
jgi:hypothetical protein